MRTRWMILGTVAAVGTAGIGCGGTEQRIANESRPPMRVALSVAIADGSMRVSPRREGAGPMSFVVANLTPSPWYVTLEGDRTRERVGPVQPGETAEIKTTLEPGRYELRATSDRAVIAQPAPTTLSVGRQRKSSNTELLLP